MWNFCKATLEFEKLAGQMLWKWSSVIHLLHHLLLLFFLLNFLSLLLQSFIFSSSSFSSSSSISSFSSSSAPPPPPWFSPDLCWRWGRPGRGRFPLQRPLQAARSPAFLHRRRRRTASVGDAGSRASPGSPELSRRGGRRPPRLEESSSGSSWSPRHPERAALICCTSWSRRPRLTCAGSAL